MKSMAITGHRPNVLGWGYNLRTKPYYTLATHIRKFILESGIDTVYTGMALGVDTVCALVVLKLKSEGHDIKLICALPCKNQSCKWQQESIDEYNKILAKADVIHYVTNKEYTPSCMQLRNIYMVDNADILLGVWNGNRFGGTFNCLSYAKSKSKTTFILNPIEL